MTTSIAEARGREDIHDVRQLFREYAAALDVDLSFQDFAAELADLPGKYAPPSGQIFIGRDQTGHPVGCVAVRPLGAAGECEMKRLFVRPEARGCDLGRRLAEAIIDYARNAGYARMRLDTLLSMRAARSLYASLGFQETDPYYESVIPDTVYLALEL